MENKDISSLSDEELLALASKEEVTTDDIFLNKKHFDIVKILQQYKIEAGDIPISPTLIFKLIRFHMKIAVNNDEVFLYLSTIFPVNPEGYFLINQKSNDIIYKVFPKDEYSIKWKKEYLDRSKETIQRFINDLKLKNGKIAVNVQILYFIFGKWAKENKLQTTRFNTFKDIAAKRFKYFNESFKIYLLLDECVLQYVTDDIMQTYNINKEPH